MAAASLSDMEQKEAGRPERERASARLAGVAHCVHPSEVVVDGWVGQPDCELTGYRIETGKGFPPVSGPVDTGNACEA